MDLLEIAKARDWPVGFLRVWLQQLQDANLVYKNDLQKYFPNRARYEILRTGSNGDDERLEQAISEVIFYTLSEVYSSTHILHVLHENNKFCARNTHFLIVLIK